MKTKMFWIGVGSIVVLLLGGAIYWGVGNGDETPRVKVLLSIVQPLLTFWLVGVFGMIAKQILEEAQKEKEKRAAAAQKKKEEDDLRRSLMAQTFRALLQQCRGVYRSILAKSPMNRLHDLFDVYKGQGGLGYDDLLDEWETIESDGPVEKARSDFIELARRYDAAEDKVDVRESTQRQINAWLEYYVARWRVAVWGGTIPDWPSTTGSL